VQRRSLVDIIVGALEERILQKGLIAAGVILAPAVVYYLKHNRAAALRRKALVDKQRILAQYQSAVGEKDRVLALSVLESTSWNLEVALRERGQQTPPAPPAASQGLLGHMLEYLSSLLPLGPLDDASPATSVRLHVLEFEEQYGTAHPAFFEGSMREALVHARNDSRFLLVYLHSPEHIDTRTFCREVLSSRVVVEFLEANFVLWSLGVQYPAGHEASISLSATTYPFVALLDTSRSETSILDAVEGLTTADEFVARLAGALAEHEPRLAAARAQAQVQRANRVMIEEQDRAYQESLEADQKKERDRQAAIAAEQRALAEAERQRRELVAASQKQKQELDRKRRSLGAEPPAEPASAVTTIAVRLPSGARLSRRFPIDARVASVYDWVDVSQDAVGALPIGSYNLVSSFPRATYSDQSLTLSEAKLVPQAALFLSPKESLSRSQ
jgi:FAS-associated factor 2